jgi:FAD/FMN-containing dehydrogenase
VHIAHLDYFDGSLYFQSLEKRLLAGAADFVDGTVFAPDKMFITLARMVDKAPYTSDYTFENIYYRSIPAKHDDYLTIHDYLWRWDTDWFWCSKNVMAQNRFVRRFVYGRKRLGSRQYTKIMRWNARVGLTRKLEQLLGLHSESVIQDVDIPIARAAEFLQFYAREIGLWPVWICPIGPAREGGRFALYPMREGWYVNFGFWDVKRTREPHPPGHFNRLIEQKVTELGGIKSLYSDSYFEREEFERLYGGEEYKRLKANYDPGNAFPTLYEKCVLKA